MNNKELIVIEFVKIAMNEYKYIRDEILQSMSNRNHIFNFGLGFLGAVFYVGSYALSSNSVIQSKEFSFFVFYFGIPAISFLILTLWIGETVRMLRAGTYLVKKEKTINELLHYLYHKVLDDLSDEEKKYYLKTFSYLVSWETYIRKTTNPSQKRPRISEAVFSYYAVGAIFVGMASVSIFISLAFILPMLNLTSYMNWIFFVGGIVSVTIITIIFKRYSGNILRNLPIPSDTNE